MYCQDYDERVLINSWNSDTFGTSPPAVEMRQIFAERLQPYAKNYGMFLCPSDGRPWQRADQVATGPGSPGKPLSGSYAFHSYGHWKLAEIQAPAEFFVAWDTAVPACRQGNDTWIGTEDVTGAYTWATTACFAARHQDQINMVFADGHSKSMRCAQVFPCRSRGWQLNNIASDSAGCWARSNDPYIANNGRTIPAMACPAANDSQTADP
jgi:prepilin-type processing-associated H-X9-DG protein